MIWADIDIAARTVWGEARGEGPDGMRAVAHTLLNRLRAAYGQFRQDDTLATSCLRHRQFSVWNVGNPNFEKIQAVGFEDRAFRQAVIAVLVALDSPDPTHGATHYHARSIRPLWAIGFEPCFETDGHLFYRDIP